LRLKIADRFAELWTWVTLVGGAPTSRPIFAYSEISTTLILLNNRRSYIVAARGSISIFKGLAMKNRLNALRNRWIDKQRGGIGYIFLWLLGVPIPVLLLISLLRGCH